MISNADKLASVLAYWAKPAIAQIATSKLMGLPIMQSAEATLVASGLVGDGYNLADDIGPFVAPVVDGLITPILSKYLSGVPDEAIPATANAIVEQMVASKTLTILDGLITFDEADINELADLLCKNLPISSHQGEQYELIK